VMSLDPEMKMNRYNKGKYLLRHAFEGLDYLPDGILWREKAAFSDAVGHSMGGLLALLLAAEKPLERVVTLAAPMAICKERGIDLLPPRGASREKYAPKAKRRLKNVPAAVNRTYRKIPLLSVHELLETIELTKSRLAEVKIPLLIVHSHGDHTAEPASADYILEHAGSREKKILWFRDSGHQLPLDVDREKVFEGVADFLKEIG